MFNIPNLITAGNLLCGIFAILLSLAGRIDLAPFAIFAGAFLDFFDGFAARKLKVSGELGKQLDSLADMVTFGLAPGVMMMVVIITCIYMDGLIYSDNFASHVHFQLLNWVNALFYGVPNSMDASIVYLPLTALFIPFMSMFRLAKFNLDLRQTDSFIGVPTPMNTIFFCFYPLALAMGFEEWKREPDWYGIIFNVYFIVGLIVVMSLLLVSELPLFSLKFKHFSWKGNEIRFIFLFLCTVLIIALQVWSIPLIVILYLGLSIIENRFLKKRSTE